VKLYALFFLFSACFAQPHFILIGPPGGGKGTFSSYLKKQFGYVQICPGDILRSHIKNNTDLGKQIKPIVEKGNYIDDEIVLQIIDESISDCLSRKVPFIIDGFPRSVSTMDALNAMFQQKNIAHLITFIQLQCPDDLCCQRIQERIVCFGCFEVYNTTTKKPLDPATCDVCKSQLEHRLGDSRENTFKRLDYFRKNIEPLMQDAKKLGYNSLFIDTAQSPEACLAAYQSIMNH
jgi:adenylate kinase